MDKKLFSVAAAYESMNRPIEEAKADEGNAFTKALMAAREKGDKTFTVAGKQYKCEDYDEAGKLKVDEDVTSADKKPENVVGPDGKTRTRMVPVKKKSEAKLDPVGKADADIDNDGDVDKSDEYLHNRRKAIKKAMKKEDTDIRGRLMSIWEDAAEITEADRAKHYKGATKPEPMNKADADQKMYDAHQNPDKHGEIGKEADDSSKAERSGPGGKSARTNDAKLGDKKIINQIANAYKTMKSGQDV
jgi:hypothetical protein